MHFRRRRLEKPRLGIDPKNVKTGVYETLINDLHPRDIIRTTDSPNLDILCSHIDLVGAEIELINLPNREYMMRLALKLMTAKHQCIPRHMNENHEHASGRRCIQPSE